MRDCPAGQDNDRQNASHPDEETHDIGHIDLVAHYMTTGWMTNMRAEEEPVQQDVIGRRKGMIGWTARGGMPDLGSAITGMRDDMWLNMRCQVRYRMRWMSRVVTRMPAGVATRMGNRETTNRGEGHQKEGELDHGVHIGGLDRGSQLKSPLSSWRP